MQNNWNRLRYWDFPELPSNMQFAMFVGLLIICLSSANLQYAQLIFVVVSAAVFLLQIVPVGDLIWPVTMPPGHLHTLGDPHLRYFFLWIPEARFSKVPFSNGPVKLLFTCKIEVLIVLIIKLSVNETKWSIFLARGTFLENPDNFWGPKANFNIETCWIVAQFHARKQVNFRC